MIACLDLPFWSIVFVFQGVSLQNDLHVPFLGPPNKQAPFCLKTCWDAEASLFACGRCWAACVPVVTTFNCSRLSDSVFLEETKRRTRLVGPRIF